MRDLTIAGERGWASRLGLGNDLELLGVIHNLLTCAFLIRRERVEGKIRGRSGQEK
jgi:hypothetical protein